MSPPAIHNIREFMRMCGVHIFRTEIRIQFHSHSLARWMNLPNLWFFLHLTYLKRQLTGWLGVIIFFFFDRNQIAEKWRDKGCLPVLWVYRTPRNPSVPSNHGVIYGEGATCYECYSCKGPVGPKGKHSSISNCWCFVLRMLNFSSENSDKRWKSSHHFLLTAVS